MVSEKLGEQGDLSCHFELNVSDAPLAVLDLRIHYRLQRRQKEAFRVVLFEPRAIEIHSFTDEGIARLFTVFISETVATFPLCRGDAYSSLFEILILMIHE